MNFVDALSSLAAFAAGIVVITETVSKLFVRLGLNAPNKTWGWVVSALVGIGGGIAASYLQLGMFADPEVIAFAKFYVTGGAVGFVATLVANGLFALDMARVILAFFKIRVPIDKEQ
jgi:hypothetical protein